MWRQGGRADDIYGFIPLLSEQVQDLSKIGIGKQSQALKVIDLSVIN